MKSHNNPVFRRSALLSLVVTGCMLLSLSVAACGSSNSSSDGEAAGSGTGTLKIALNDPLSGVGAYYGVPQVSAFQVVADSYNQAGGIDVGGKKYKIQLIKDDNKWDPATTRQLINKEVQSDKVSVVVTTGDPGDPIIVPITEQNKVLVADWTANSDLTKPPNQYVYDSFVNPYVSADSYYEQIRKLEPQVKTVYHVATDLQFDRNNAKWDEAAAKKAGLKWLGSTIYPTGGVDFASALAPVLRAKPDMIALGSEGSNTPAILKELRQAGFKGVIGSDVPDADVQGYITGAGAAANGFYQLEAFSWPATPALKKFEKEYEQAGVKWNTLAPTHWLNAQLLFKSIQKAGTISNAGAIMKAAEGVTITNPFMEGDPTVRLGGQQTYGHPRQFEMPLALNQVVNGKVQTKAKIDIQIP